MFYNATTKPLFLYGGAVWSMTSKTNIKRVFRLQKRAASIILDVKTKEERTVSLFKKLNWMPFYDEINVNKLCLIFKCLQGQCKKYLCNKLVLVSDNSVRSSRFGHITLRYPKFNRKTEGGKTFLTSSILLWNSLTVKIRSSESINSLKRKYIECIKEGHANIDHFQIS